MNGQTARQLGEDALSAVRQLSAYYRCRIEVSSDTGQLLGKVCCTASDGPRLRQGFGPSVAEAVENFHYQPIPGKNRVYPQKT